MRGGGKAPSQSTIGHALNALLLPQNTPAHIVNYQDQLGSKASAGALINMIGRTGEKISRDANHLNECRPGQQIFS